jgi:hypothetical protein
MTKKKAQNLEELFDKLQHIELFELDPNLKEALLTADDSKKLLKIDIPNIDEIIEELIKMTEPNKEYSVILNVVSNLPKIKDLSNNFI